jgi:hypothetical protein
MSLVAFGEAPIDGEIILGHAAGGKAPFEPGTNFLAREE